MHTFRFDVNNANINDQNFDRIKPERRPDVVLVKKLFADPQKRHKKRKWKLKHLDLRLETGSQDKLVFVFILVRLWIPSMRDKIALVLLRIHCKESRSPE